MRRIRVLFCCEHSFPAGFACTLAALTSSEREYVDVVRVDRDDVHREIAACDVAVPLMTRLDAQMLKIGAAGRLRLVVQFGVGLEGVDIRAATACGVRVARIPSERTGNASSTAEMAVFLLLAALRETNEMRASIAGSRLGNPCGRSLEDCEVMIVGMGAIGVKIAERLRGFGCSMTAARNRAWDASTVPDGINDGCSISDAKKFDLLLGNADAVVLACTQDASNKGMIDAAFLAKMKPNAALVNIARGGLFNRDDILSALNSGHLGYLASDVAWLEPVDPSDELVNHHRAYFTPHVGGVTQSSYRTMGRIIANVAVALNEDDIDSLADIQIVN
ncbi:D-isomer specific 2-hydroxyacid dehydrogenase,NAD-binding [Ostreococcus tauri]|uniref:D-isomer specific 2-hydroxyacid dehydrogenase,NAD-binding n=1 Tax=Ostreococcus tauri TaxID=70448 RepID=Q00W84_OSTTA|nr:D-isomer specific 2-hydroxyacid dehydrogenase,NAD-binding [Ostreococcus tauri]CAL56874.1 D-isomer specific 2-hydroxyacid dehydrogenase,NAD-binding [Ostreococcus tauri]|eukprot:XP_003082919.1 D-isomer specific 2-hydroxyacid dehydrogenase,NAD-binding [Ostreococcus tauri]